MRAATFEVGGVRWWLGAGVAPDAVRPLLERAARLFESPEPHEGERKRGRRKALYTLEPEPGGAGVEHLVKINRYLEGRDALRRFRPAKARRELAVAEGLAAAGVAVPLPIAAGEVRRRRRLVACLLVVPVEPDSIDLQRAWRAPDVAPAQRRLWIEQVGVLARRLHDVGLDQPDFAPNNFLLRSQTGDTLPIDFERARLGGSVGPARRRAMLAKLERHLFDASAAERLRFLAAYTGGTTGARAEWASLREAGAALARRDHARWKRIATRESRQFLPVDWPDAQGWIRRDAESIDAAKRWAGSPPRGDVHGDCVQQAAGVWTVRYRDLDGERLRDVWANAQLLAQRGLAPRPVAALETRDAAHLLFHPPRGCEPLCDAAAQAAATVLFDRLHRLAQVDPPCPGSIGFERDSRERPRALLLDPRAIHVGGQVRGPGAGDRSAARAAAAYTAHTREAAVAGDI